MSEKNVRNGEVTNFMNRRPVPGPEPTLGAWLVVFRSIGRVLAEIAGSFLRLFLFTFRRDSWRRKIGERIAAGALPVHRESTLAEKGSS